MLAEHFQKKMRSAHGRCIQGTNEPRGKTTWRIIGLLSLKTSCTTSLLLLIHRDSSQSKRACVRAYARSQHHTGSPKISCNQPTASWPWRIVVWLRGGCWGKNFLHARHLPRASPTVIRSRGPLASSLFTAASQHFIGSTMTTPAVGRTMQETRWKYSSLSVPTSL